MLVTMRRRTRAPVAAASFALARVRAHPSRGLVTGLGIAVAIASLFLTSGAPIIAGDVALGRALDELPPGDRSVAVAVAVNRKPLDELRAIDASIRAGLRAPGLAPPRALVEYRELAAPDSTVFRVAGIEQLADSVTLLDGRLPESCTPTRCEVVVAGEGSVRLPADLALVVVGRVVLTDRTLLAGQFLPEPDEVVLLGNGVEAVGAIEPLELIGRSLGWVAAIDSRGIRIDQIDGVLGAASAINANYSQGGPQISLPNEALLAARARAQTASKRVALVAAQSVVLLAAFAVLAAGGARRQHRLARQLLLQRGASRIAANVFTTCEAVWPVVVGLALGIPVGLGATAVVARRADLDASRIVAAVVADSAVRVAIGAVALLVATAIVIAVAPSAPVARLPRPWWRPMAIDGIGIAALGIGALAIGRGDTTPATLVADGDPLLATMPVLAAVIMAWLAVRLVPALIAGVAHLLGRRAPLVSAALGEVRRRPVVPLATAGFLAAATTLGLFALGYRATLQQGGRDQAAFAVPYDITLTSGRQLVRPQQTEPPGGWAALAPSVRATEVLRRGVTVQSPSLTNDPVTLLGLDPATLTALRGWRDDFGPTPAEMAGLIAADAPPTLGTAIPAGTGQLVIRGSGELDRADIDAVLSRADGTWHELPTAVDEQDTTTRTVTLDPEDAGGRFIGFRISEPERAAQLTQHAIGEGNRSVAGFTADLTLASVDADGIALDLDWASLQTANADLAAAAGGGLHVQLVLQGYTALLVPDVPAQARQLPAIVDPATAATARNGIVSIGLTNGERAQLRVVGVATRFPGAPDRFAVVDRDVAQVAFDLVQPGYGTSNEVWIAAAPGDRRQLAAALRSSPFTALDVADRAAIESHLRTDPLAEFTLGLFAVAGLIAAVLAVGAVYLAALSDATEQAPLHRALAAEGVAPGALSRMVRTTSMAMAVAAIALGVLGALAFLRVVTRVIAVTAAAAVPVPPLVAAVPVGGLVVALAALTVLCVGASTLAAQAARRAARGDLLREFG